MIDATPQDVGRRVVYHGVTKVKGAIANVNYAPAGGIWPEGYKKVFVQFDHALPGATLWIGESDMDWLEPKKPFCKTVVSDYPANSPLPGRTPAIQKDFPMSKELNQRRLMVLATAIASVLLILEDKEFDGAEGAAAEPTTDTTAQTETRTGAGRPPGAKNKPKPADEPKAETAKNTATGGKAKPATDAGTGGKDKATTLDDAKAAVAALSKATDRDTAKALLARFGVEKSDQLDEGQYSAFTAACGEVQNGVAVEDVDIGEEAEGDEDL